MLNPMNAWQPGLLVHYHGSLTNLHGTYRAYPCTCLSCNDSDQISVSFSLVDQDGATQIDHVRPSSITPTGEDNNGHGDYSKPHRDSTGEYVDSTGEYVDSAGLPF